MDNPDTYIDLNKQTWNNKVDVHIASDSYENKSFLNGKSALNAIELKLLGDISCKKILHLQCHFGQDTISFSRLGVKATGVNLSDKAIERGKEFNFILGADAKFICWDIYNLPNHFEKKFDILFTSYETIGWMPDLDKSPKVISRFLKSNGKFITSDFYPAIWVYDDDFTKVFYNNFNTEAICEDGSGTDAEKEAAIENKTISLNHPISKILNALISNNLEMNQFNEFNYSPYQRI